MLRPSLQDIDLDERRLDAAVGRGERFGRATASFTLAHRYDREFGLALVLDAVTGMPVEIVEADQPVVRWVELDVVDALDDELFTWRGEVARSGRPGREATDDDLDKEVPAHARQAVRRAEERAWSAEDELELPEIVAQTVMDVEVSSSDPGAITIMLEASPYVLIEGAATPGRLVDEGDVERWTTAEGWTWTLCASELHDESLEESRHASSCRRIHAEGVPLRLHEHADGAGVARGLGPVPHPGRRALDLGLRPVRELPARSPGDVGGLRRGPRAAAVHRGRKRLHHAAVGEPVERQALSEVRRSPSTSSSKDATTGPVRRPASRSSPPVPC